MGISLNGAAILVLLARRSAGRLATGLSMQDPFEKLATESLALAVRLGLRGGRVRRRGEKAALMGDHGHAPALGGDRPSPQPGWNRPPVRAATTKKTAALPTAPGGTV